MTAFTCGTWRCCRPPPEWSWRCCSKSWSSLGACRTKSSGSSSSLFPRPPGGADPSCRRPRSTGGGRAPGDLRPKRGRMPTTSLSFQRERVGRRWTLYGGVRSPLRWTLRAGAAASQACGMWRNSLSGLSTRFWSDVVSVVGRRCGCSGCASACTAPHGTWPLSHSWRVPCGRPSVWLRVAALPPRG